MRRAALAVLAVAVVALAALAVRFVTVKHDFPAETISPPPNRVVSLLPLPGGESVCMTRVVIEHHARQARLQVGTYGRRGPALTLTIQGPSYRATRTISGGYADNTPQVVALPPPRSDQLVTVCIRNRGRRAVALYSAAGASASRVHVAVGGHHVDGITPDLTFWEGRQLSLADRFGLTIDRIATFRGFLGHAWVVYLIGLLFLIGVPGALVAGFVIVTRPRA